MADWGGTVVFADTDYYNSDDLTRENQNIEYLKEQLELKGYTIVLSHPIISVEITDFPKVSFINNTRQNIIDIGDGFYYPPYAPEIVVNSDRIQFFGKDEANALEGGLQVIYDLMNAIDEGYRYCGTFNCGEESLL